MRRLITLLSITDGQLKLNVENADATVQSEEVWPLAEMKGPIGQLNIDAPSLPAPSPYPTATTDNPGPSYPIPDPATTDTSEVSLTFSNGRILRIDVRDVQSPTFANTQALADFIEAGIP